MCQTAAYYFIGKDPTFALSVLGAVRPQYAPAECLAVSRDGGIELMNEFFKKYNIYGLPAGNTGARWAAGSARRSRRSPTSTA